MSVQQYANNPSTTLSGALTAGATSLSVVSGAGFPSQGNFTIIIDSEIILVTGVAGTTWTVQRGTEDTTAAAHNNNATVTQILTKRSFLNALHHDLRAYGAAGDGSTEDTAALQAAVNDAVVSGLPVFVPDGTYIIDSISTSTGNGTKPLTIRGSGFGAVLKLKAATTTGNLFFVNPSTVSSLVVENLKIDGNKANVSGDGRNAFRVHCDDAQFRNVMFVDTIQEGIYHSPGSGGLNSRMAVTDCIFVGCGRYGIAAERISGLTVTGNLAENCGAGLIDVEPGNVADASYNITITGNVNKNSGNAVPTAGAIQVWGVTGGSLGSVARCTITGNIVDAAQSSGIQVGAMSSCSIIGNVVRGATRHGIANSDGGTTVGSLAITVQGNIVADCGSEVANTYSGIMLDRVTESIVTGNVISDGSSKHKYHLELTADCNNNVVGMNNYRGTAVTAQQIIGGASNTTFASHNS